MSKIQEIIEGYCEGHYHLEFSKDHFPAMIAEIKKEMIAEIRNKPNTWEDAVEAILELWI